MGSLQSKDLGTIFQEQCPATPTHSTRALDSEFDPRSPSVDVTRTPIQVEKTPEALIDPRSPSAEIARTPIHAGKSLQHEFEPVMQLESSDVPATPVSKENQHKDDIQDIFDPRSPSEGITRTPLHINKISEFDPRSPSEGVTRTPLHLNKPADLDLRSTEDVFSTPLHLPCIEGDPRSPGGAIVRTPLVFNKPSEMDPRSPSVEIARTPICTKLTDDEEIASLKAPEELQPTKEEPAAEEKQDQAQDKAEGLPKFDAEGIISLSKLMEALEEMDEKPMEADLVPKTPTTPKEEMVLRKRKPKVLFQGNSNASLPEGSPRSPLKAISNTVRSPLAVKDNSRSPLKVKESGSKMNVKRNVDVNSPRAIVQRKQATKLNSKLTQGCAMAASSQGRSSRSPARTRSPAKKNQFQIYEDDKENV